MRAFSAPAPSTASARVLAGATGATSRSKIGTLLARCPRARAFGARFRRARLDRRRLRRRRERRVGGPPRVLRRARGTPAPIPEKFMPPAFKEWGQVLVDWQSQCAMCVTPGEGIYARELRFIPTAGCEADSSTVETQWDRTVDANEVSPAVSSGSSTDTSRNVAPGSYNAGPIALDPSAEIGAEAVVEHCLGFDDAPKADGSEGRRARVRVQQHLRFSDATDAGENGGWTLAAITAWKEYYYEPFNNAASLCASCGGPNKWGEYPTLPVETFTDGAWEGDAWGGFGGDDAAHVVLLPTGVYRRFSKTKPRARRGVPRGGCSGPRRVVPSAVARRRDAPGVVARVREGRLVTRRDVREARKERRREGVAVLV